MRAWCLLLGLVLTMPSSPAFGAFAVIPRANISVPSVVSTQSGNPGSNAIDGNPGNMWLTQQACNAAPYCWIIFRFTQDYDTNKLVYYPNIKTSQTNGRVGTYHIYTTTNTACDINSTWTEVATGTWANDTKTKKAEWTPTTARCIKLESRLSAGGSTSQMHVADMYFFENRTYATETPGTAAATDFATRCAAAGVTACYGFDEAPVGAGSDHFKDAFGVDHGVNIVKSAQGAGSQLPTWDQTFKTSGGGSLRFTAEPPPSDGADIAGQFILNPSSNVSIAGAGQDYGPNEDLYLQFRRRVSSEALFNTWIDDGGNGPGMKLFALYQYPTPCTDLQLVIAGYFDTEQLSGYTTCGGTWGFITLSDLETKTHTTPYRLNQGDFTDCAYNTFNDCYQMRPDEWTTYYCKFHIGTITTAPATRVPDSSVECWTAPQGATAWTKFFNVTKEWSLARAAGGSGGFNALFMSMYMTDLIASSGDAGVTSIVNYDEVIVSSQPIALPGTASPPAVGGKSGGGSGSGGGIQR